MIRAGGLSWWGSLGEAPGLLGIPGMSHTTPGEAAHVAFYTQAALSELSRLVED